jgi:dihydroorotase
MEELENSEFFYHGKFYRNGTFDDLYIGIADGKIKSMSKFQNVKRVIELNGAVFPGATDIHVHFRDPGETDKEDFSTGSMSAIFGGTTTIMDMPNNSISVVDYEIYEKKKSAIKGRSFCDYGFHSMFNGDNIPLIHKESAGIKVFMGESTNATGIEEISEANQSKLDELGKNIIFHCESGSCLRNNAIKEESMCDHHFSRKSQCELDAMKKMNSFSMRRKIAAHISDYGNVRSLGDITFQKEILPQHMLLSCEKLSGSWGKVNPPIRDEKTRMENFQAYINGDIQLLSSDHAPHTEYDKGDFQHAKSGMIGVETRVPLILNLVRKKIVPMEVFVNTAILNPPAQFGLKKGVIEKGYGADFFTVNFSSARKINEGRLHSKNPFTPFHGFEAIFPDNVVLGGEIAIENNELIDDHFGKYKSFDKIMEP